MKSKEELLKMVDKIEYAELFAELDAMGQDSATYNALKEEFITTQFNNYTFPKRLKVFINNIFLKKKITKISAIAIIPILLSIAGFWAYKNYFPTQPTCYFKAEDKNFKVLILPFKAYGCDKKDDIGAEISRQLEILNLEEKLEITHHFAYDRYITEAFTADSAYILKEKYCADMVVHGNYRKDECTSQSKQDVCLIWQMDSINKGNEKADTLMMAELSKGKLQGSIHSIVFWIAGSKSFKKENYIKALKCVLYIQNKLNIETDYLKFTIANCYEKNKDYKNAKLYYEECINLNKNNAEAYNNLGLLLQNDYFKDYEGAKKNYLEAIKINKNLSYTYYNLAILLADNFKDYEGARLNFEKAKEIDKNDALAYKRLADILTHNFKDYEEAKKNYEMAIKIDNNYSRAYNNLGLLLENDYFKDYEGAKKNFEKTIILDKDNDSPYYNLAMLLADNFKDYEGAKKNFEKAIELNKKEASNYANFYYLLTTHFKDYENAEKNLLKALELAPEDVTINFNYAFFLYHYKKPSPLVYIPEIQKYYRKAIHLNPQKQSLEFEQDFQQVTGQSLR